MINVNVWIRMLLRLRVLQRHNKLKSNELKAIQSLQASIPLFELGTDPDWVATPNHIETFKRISDDNLSQRELEALFVKV